MSSGISPANSRGLVEPSRRADLTNQFVCPYCGAVNESPEGHCPHCTMENTPAARKATKARIGPWYVLQKRNPAAPGMKFDTLLSFVHKGRVKAHSIVRGPTTHQLWRFAAHIKGLSREFGLCYSCGSPLETSALICPQCNRAQSFVTQPDVFLESVDGEAAAVVYRELPASPVTPAGTDDSSANRAQTTMQDAIPDAASSEASRTPPLSERSANERDVAHPAIENDRDMVIPSLPEETSPAPARPTSARERLAQARRMRSFNSDGIDTDEIGDTTFEDGPAHSPGQVGPTFVPGARPLPPRVRRRTWIEGGLFVAILLAALGSGLMYVDPRLQALVEGWTNSGLSAIGVKFDSKSPDAAPPTDLSPAYPLVKLPPVTNTGSPTPVRPTVTTPSAPLAPAPHSSGAAAPIVPAPPAAVSIGAAPQPAPPAAVDHGSHAPAPEPVVHLPPPPAPDEIATPAPEASAAPDTTDDDPFTRARALRRRAIDAENSGDYVKAVSLFEQIKELPRDAWPGDLDLRLRAAKANADGKPRH